MTIQRNVKKALICVLFIGLTGSLAYSQWSILAPGKREAKPGNHRYAYLVFATPVPGHENEFNDWYTNTHLGDLVQKPGFIGAQRFRIVTSLDPLPTKLGYSRGFLVYWDTEDTPPNAPNFTNRPSPYFGYQNESPSVVYQIMGPKITRPDGKGPTMPVDEKTFRPNRYILLEMETPLPGKETEFDKAANQRIKDVLTLPGWMAAQRYVLNKVNRVGKPKYLTLWETEGDSAQAINTTLLHAMKSGTVKPNDAADPSTAELTYWEPITPYITREDFAR